MDDEDLKRAKESAIEMATKFDTSLANLKGKRIRVIRALVYEGDAETVLSQLGRSMPPGTKVWGKPGKEISITVVDNGLLKILEE